MLVDDRELEKAHRAYQRGEMPISRWDKKSFLSAVKKELGFLPDWVMNLPRTGMYAYLKATGVYLTGNRIFHRNTVFYALDYKKIRNP